MNIHTDISQSELVALVSAVVTVIAGFLPWIRGVQAGPIEVGATQTGIEGMGLLTLILAVVVIGAILTFGKRAKGWIATVIGGLGIAIVSIWKLVDLGDPVAPGIGLYLTILGGFGILVGGVLTYRGRTQN